MAAIPATSVAATGNQPAGRPASQPAGKKAQPGRQASRRVQAVQGRGGQAGKRIFTPARVIFTAAKPWEPARQAARLPASFGWLPTCPSPPCPALPACACLLTWLSACLLACRLAAGCPDGLLPVAATLAAGVAGIPRRPQNMFTPARALSMYHQKNIFTPARVLFTAAKTMGPAGALLVQCW